MLKAISIPLSCRKICDNSISATFSYFDHFREAAKMIIYPPLSYS